MSSAPNAPGNLDRMGSHRASSDPMQVLELGTVEYTEAWEQQRAHARRARRRAPAPTS